MAAFPGSQNQRTEEGGVKSADRGLLQLLADVNIFENPAADSVPLSPEKPVNMELPKLWFETGTEAPILRIPSLFLNLPLSERVSKRRVPPSRSYKCPIQDCKKAFLDSSSLYKHIQTHGEPQHYCSFPGCKKPFYEKAKLRRHMLVHTVESTQGERAFKCDICDKYFALGFNLKTHLRTHTGEKPFTCSVPGCLKRFTQSSNLSSHLKTHRHTVELWPKSPSLSSVE